MFDSLWPHGLQHTRLPSPSPIPGACWNSCPLSQWCHPNVSSSVIPLSSCLLSFPASGSLTMSHFFTSGYQSIGASTSASVFPMNFQNWFPLRLTGWISLKSKGLSRVFSNTTVQKHQFFSTQLSLWSNSHIHTWLLEKSQLRLYGPLTVCHVWKSLLFATDEGDFLKNYCSNSGSLYFKPKLSLIWI